MSPTIERATAVSEALFENGLSDEKEREMLGKEYEFVNGKPEARKMGSSKHGGVGSRLIVKLGAYVEANNLGGVYGADTTYLIGENDRIPDVSFLSAARIPEEGETDKKWLIAPDLAVEVISPNDIWIEVMDKIHNYFAAGVRQVWLINLKHRRVYVYDSPDLISVLTEEQDLTNEALLPGFRCRIADLFKQPSHAG